MSRVKAECCFHSVGQGLFYSGIISKYASNCYDQFSFVYDCGSLNAKKRAQEIDLFKSNLKDKKINLLVISHFDLDHINGLDRLLSKTTVDTVIIPYYSLAERIMLATEEGVGKAETEFYQDTYKYLSERNVKNIVISDSERVFAEFKNRNDFESERSQGATIGELQFEYLISLGNIGKTKIYNLANKGVQSIRFCWEFIFQDSAIDRELLDFIEKEISSIVKNDPLDVVLKDRKRKKQIRDVYDAVSNGHKNRTSILMYHNAMNPASNITPLEYQFDCYHCRKDCFCNHRHINRHKSGTLLTGDSELKSNETLGKIENYVEKIQFFQVPHHGSRKNWEMHHWGKYDFRTNIISVGIVNKYAHPNREVIDDIRGSLNMLAIVNEYQNYSYTVFTEV